jgi:hypothetical protein
LTGAGPDSRYLVAHGGTRRALWSIPWGALDSPLMKGRHSFTAAELAELRGLIAEKQTANRTRQKTLRGRMRAIGFYITDFLGDPEGFTVSDFDELLERGLVRIEEGAKPAQSSGASPGQGPSAASGQSTRTRSARRPAPAEGAPPRASSRSGSTSSWSPKRRRAHSTATSTSPTFASRTASFAMSVGASSVATRRVKERPISSRSSGNEVSS